MRCSLLQTLWGHTRPIRALVWRPAERLLDIVGGARLAITTCAVRWASSMCVAINYKAASGAGLKGGELSGSTFHQCACGLYIINQARPADASANSDDLRVAGNAFRDIDTQNVYGSRDTHAIGIQGGSRNVYERNVIDGAGGSGITFYQGVGQTMDSNVVRGNLVMNVRSAEPSRNQRGIEYAANIFRTRAHSQSGAPSL